MGDPRVPDGPVRPPRVLVTPNLAPQPSQVQRERNDAQVAMLERLFIDDQTTKATESWNKSKV